MIITAIAINGVVAIGISGSIGVGFVGSAIKGVTYINYKYDWVYIPDLASMILTREVRQDYVILS